MKKRRVIKTCKNIICGVLAVALLAIVMRLLFDIVLQLRQAGNSGAEIQLALERITTAEERVAEANQQFAAFSEQKGRLLTLYINRNSEQDVRTNLSALASEYGVDEFYLYDEEQELLTWSGGAQLSSQADLLQLIEEGGSITRDHIRYYAAETANGWSLVYGVDFTDEEALLEGALNLNDIFGNIKVGIGGYMIAVDTANRTVLLDAQNEEYEGQVIDDLVDIDLTNPYFLENGDYLTLGGERYYATWAEEDVHGYGVLALVPATELELSARFTTAIVLVIFAAVVVLMICYAAFLPDDKEIPHEHRHIIGRWYLDHTLLFRITNIVIVGMVLLVGSIYYIETLSPLSRWGMLAENRLQTISTVLHAGERVTDNLRSIFDLNNTELAQGLAYQFDLDSDFSQEYLQEISNRANLYAITVVDGDGNTEGSSSNNAYFKLSNNKEDQTYEFWDVIKGFRNIIIQDPVQDDDGNTVQWIAVRREDTDGMIQIGVRPELLTTWEKAVEPGALLQQIPVENQGFLFAVSSDDAHLIYSWPSEDDRGNPAEDYGLDESIYVQNYSGYQTIEDERYLISGSKYNAEVYVYIAFPLDVIYTTRTVVTIMITIGVVIILGLLSLRMVIFRKLPDTGSTESAPTPEIPEEVAAGTTAEEAPAVEDGLEGVQAIRIPHWRDLGADRKVALIAQAIILLSYIALLMYLSVFGSVAMNDALIAYIVNCKWEKGVNIFSITYILGYMTTVMMAAWVVRIVLSYVLSRFGPRMQTISRLVGSFIKYAALIGGGFHCLSAIGVNPSALVTTAGVVTFVGGFGAKDMVADIVAGIFIIIEGTFRVGDIITIGDWKGTVIEIGIRTTKVKKGGNIKVFNNSTISNVINMTKDLSSVFIEIGIGYEESLERVEAILEEELPLIRRRIPQIVKGPYYSGVSSLGDSSVNIGIYARAQEKDVLRVKNMLNRELKLLCDRRGIEMPYPQIVVREAAEEGAAMKETDES